MSCANFSSSMLKIRPFIEPHLEPVTGFCTVSERLVEAERHLGRCFSASCDPCTRLAPLSIDVDVPSNDDRDFNH